MIILTRPFLYKCIDWFRLKVKSKKSKKKISLVKSPKGCNISSGEVMNTILTLKDITDDEKRQEKCHDVIDTIIKKRQNCNGVADATRLLEDHDHFRFTTSDYVLAYVAGYVARKATRFSTYTIKKKSIN